MNGLSCFHSQQVGPKTVPDNLHCLCTHLSAFGGDFFVAPNPIDFDKVWAEFGNLAESGNFVVLATVCSIFGLYFVGLVFARKADRKDEMKVRLVLFSLCTNRWRKNGFAQICSWQILVYRKNAKSEEYIQQLVRSTSC